MADIIPGPFRFPNFEQLERRGSRVFERGTTRDVRRVRETRSRRRVPRRRPPRAPTPPGVASVLGRVLGAGSLAIEALRVIIDAANKRQQQDFADEAAAQERLIKREIQKRNRDKFLRTIPVPSVAGRADFPAQSGDRGAVSDVLPLPGSRPIQAEIKSPKPEIDFDLGTIITAPGGFPTPGPIVAPTAPAAPGTPGLEPARSPAPSAVPTPGFGIGTQRIFLPAGSPASLPGQIPFFVGSPASNPVNITRRVLREAAPRFVTPTGPLTRLEGSVLQFPVPQPVPQTDPARRCKPCKEDNPKPRRQCFKGLYREGPLDTEVDFTEWAEIDCLTGVEI